MKAPTNLVAPISRTRRYAPSHAVTGNARVKTQPAPDDSVSVSSAPRCAAIWFEIASPMPLPPSRVDLQGRKIVDCKWSDNQPVDVLQLVPGLYVVNVETEDGERIQQKIVKN